MLTLDLPLPAQLLLFLLAAAAIAVAGSRMTRLADILADRTGLGEALVGAVLLGASTSLPGIVTSIFAGATGHPELAAANAAGGIVAQTAFLAIADIAYRRANLEHAAASATNLAQAVLLIILLTLPLLALSTPAVTVLGMHPATLALVLVYGAGLRLASVTARQPMWRPLATPETRRDTPDADAAPEVATAALARRFLALALLVAAAGWLVAQSGIAIARDTGLSESIVGALMTAIATSLPELATTVAAVRRGALQLAVGGIIGGNTFDVLFLALADAAYQDGSLYHAIGAGAQFWIALALLMTAVLLLGLLRREKHGIGNIGFESAALLGLYLGALGLQFTQG